MNNKDDFVLADYMVKEWIARAKAESNVTLTEDEAIEQLMSLHNRGCLVEHGMHCPACPKYGNCPIV